MSNFKRLSNANQDVHFSRALFAEVERSSLHTDPLLITTFNAGDIVPIFCKEILPEEEVDMSVDAVIRQSTISTPTLGSMHCDIYAFFVPNRIVNQSWKAVEGENLNGSWTANSVSLCRLKNTTSGSTSIPVGSVADYYGFPTQQPLPNSVLNQCHDLKFRGYVMIYNEFFRDQNYQPPIAMSTLNVYQGFLDSSGTIPLGDDGSSALNISGGDSSTATVPDGSVGAGAVANAIYGSSVSSGSPSGFNIPARLRSNSFSALSSPLKANKVHDYFTSVLPSPQKSQSPVMIPVTGGVNLPSQFVVPTSADLTTSSIPLRFRTVNDGQVPTSHLLAVQNSTSGSLVADQSNATTAGAGLFPSNLQTVAGVAQLEGLGIDLSDLRMASAIQQVYEIMARGGSRYRSIVSSFFGVEYDDPFSDVPLCLGHINRELELYQTAQTSPSESGSTPQGNLAAFGYTATGGSLFKHRFVENGYLHVFAVVRHRNIYSSYLSRDNFRLNSLDFYLPPLANISEQPVYTREINPFYQGSNTVFGYQEAWSEYRYDPDRVTGLMRTMPTGTESLSVWNYADNFDAGLNISNSSWLKSNSQEVLDRTLAVSSSLVPQFKAMFRFSIDKDLPMPTFSVPGMDII